MSLVAIINFWDGGEILPYTVKNIKPLVDEVIIVYSNASNYGELKDNESFLRDYDVTLYNVEPRQDLKPMDNERFKRNEGLKFARAKGHTYFLMMDADELYEAEPFKREYKWLIESNLNGFVCGSKVYFGSPELTIGMDTTRVPFIHKLQYAEFAFNKEYPFAFDNGIKIDPTRQMRFIRGVGWSDIIMHHYSWIREDYQSKIRNSTARSNIERSTIMNDLALARPGYFCNFYQKTLTKTENFFNICLKQNSYIVKQKNAL